MTPATIDAIIDTIESAQLRASHYRTARRLLDLVGDNGQCKISRSAMMDVCETESDGTMRAHLGALKAANIIHFSTNEAVHISFVGVPTVDGVATGASVIHQRAPMIHHGSPTRASGSPSDGETAPEEPQTASADDSVIHQRAPMIHHGSPTRASGSRPHTRGVCLFVRRSDPIHPRSNKRTNKHAVTEPPLTFERMRSFRLLTDIDVGLDPDTARQFAEQFEPDFLARQVFEWRRQLDAGTVGGTGALVNRIQSGFSAVLIAADRETELWKRHMATDDNGEEERRRKYLPDEYFGYGATA